MSAKKSKAVEPTAYGIVKIVRGKFKGRLGYYDDEDEHDRAIVYLGTPCMSADCALPFSYLEQPTAEEAKRWEEVHMSVGAYKMATRRLRVEAAKKGQS